MISAICVQCSEERLVGLEIRGGLKQTSEKILQCLEAKQSKFICITHFIPVQIQFKKLYIKK